MLIITAILQLNNGVITMRRQAQITEDFLGQFDCAGLPEPAEFFTFLEQHQLSCFVKENVRFLIIPLTNSDTGSRTHIFCLSTAKDLSPELIQKISALIFQTHENIVLYYLRIDSRQFQFQ